jgi:predicted transcriptional regulator
LDKGGYTPTGYKLGGESLETVLGPLEYDVIETIWGMTQPVKVREVYEELRKSKKIAYTTVMTTMNTLFEKGLLDRRIENGKRGLVYAYWSKMSKVEIEKTAVKQVIDSLIKNFGETATSYLVELNNSNKRKNSQG